MAAKRKHGEYNLRSGRLDRQGLSAKRKWQYRTPAVEQDPDKRLLAVPPEKGTLVTDL